MEVPINHARCKKQEASKQRKERKGKNQDALETSQIFLVPNLRLRSSRSSSISSVFCVFPFAAICSGNNHPLDS
jgi:hypothetical protein